MSKYKMIISWSELDGRFLVEVPELPGCVADGKTREEAIEMAETVISEWIETAKGLRRDIPEPQEAEHPA